MKLFVAIFILSCLAYSSEASLTQYDTSKYGFGMVNVLNEPFMQIATPQYQAKSGSMYLYLYPQIASGYDGPIYMTFNCSVMSNGGQVIQGQSILSPIGPIMKPLSFTYPAQDFQYFSLTCIYYLNLPTNAFFNFYMTQLPQIQYAGATASFAPFLESTMIKEKYYFAGWDFTPV